jgi:hypothetical protein
MFSNNTQLQLVYDFIENTGIHVFLTGKAGTGKTTFLKEIQKVSPKRMIVVAPTGVAAINAGGVTIHSFFQMPFGPHLPLGNRNDNTDEHSAGFGEQSSAVKINQNKRNIIRSLDLLIIDEISMVRSDLLDGIDEILRRFRNRAKPFGGVQLLMIGDLQQLAPVVKEDEWALLKNYYDTAFFFGSKALREAGFISIELKHIYRQTDKEFISLLNKVRNNKLDNEAMQLLNKRYLPDFKPDDNEGYITLTTHNIQAQTINEAKLRMIKDKAVIFKATIEGEFPEYSFPTDERLTLKTGAQVMFIKNDTSPEKLYFNGKTGIVVSIEDDTVYVRCKGNDSLIAVNEVEWQNMKYSINDTTKEIEEKPIGTFRQLPLRLAWAITIHKSQGLTFDRAIIDAKAAFAHGQVYVALSRCRTLEGLVLSSAIPISGIITNNLVDKFSKELEENIPGDVQLVNATIQYQRSLIAELFDFSILSRRINYCLKISREHSESLLGNPSRYFEKLIKFVQDELLNVSARFSLQIEKLTIENKSPEQNSVMQERIIKACRYFLNKLEEEGNPILKEINVITDNKTVRKSITGAFDMLTSDWTIKMGCLKACFEGFLTKKYLEARAKSSIEPTEKKRRQKIETDAGIENISYPEVFNELMTWRAKHALSLNLPYYMILSQKAIAALAQFLPDSEDDLKKIKGIGRRTVDKYGDEILDIIGQYREKNNISLKMPEPALRIVARKKVEKDTRGLTLKMFLEGKSIEEIASQRKLTAGTIGGHLAHYISNGDLDIKKLVTEEKIASISKFFITSGITNLGPAKEVLGNEISYSELRFVLNHLKFTGKILDPKGKND